MSTSPNQDTIAALAPASVWSMFAGLADHPRPSKHEELVRQHVLGVAKTHNLKARLDDVGNVLIEVPATPGFESAPVLLLQGHLDMVAEANSDSTHNFLTDPIELVIDEDAKGNAIVRANNTTLGADNGIGVALSLAAAIDPEVIHGPLELLFTIDEEMGMTGAKALEPGFFSATRMINLDTEEDDALYIGCAGGIDTSFSWNLTTTPVLDGEEACEVSVKGLRGGHSGCDIHENRGNAIKSLVRVLNAAPGVRLVKISGGSKRNAIPRESRALVVGPAGTMKALQDAVSAVVATLVEESLEPNAEINIAALSGVKAAASSSDTVQVLRSLTAVPSGVVHMHPEIDGLVQTSNNLSTIESSMEGGVVNVETCLLSRSPTASQRFEIASQIAAIGNLSGAVVSQTGEYPGWNPNPSSPLLAICEGIYSEVFDRAPKILSIHAGLECGIISDRVGGKLDAISFGPNIRGAHSPTEHVHIESVQKIWRYLKAVLKSLASA